MNPFIYANRIWNGAREEPNQYALFREIFTLKDIPNSAYVRIRVDNRYSLTVNGQWIPAQQYSDYDFYPVYDEIEIPALFFNVGENVIDILAYCQNESDQTYRKGEPSLIFEVITDGEVIAFSSEKTLVAKETAFRSGVVEKITNQMSYSFVFDAEKEENIEYDRSTVLPERDMLYRRRPIPQLNVGEPIPAKVIAQGSFIESKQSTSGMSIFKDYLSARRYGEICTGENTLPNAEGITLNCADGDGVYAVIDLQRESTGYLVFDVEVSEPCRIVCGYGEHLEDLRVRAAIGGRNFAFTIMARKGRNRVFWPIKRLGGRYFQFHVLCHMMKIYYVGLRTVEYPFGELKTPKGLNTLQKEIYDTAVHTLRLCAHEHYEDTPWREQALYAMDSRNQMMFCYHAFGETILTKESLRLLALGQKNYGLLDLCAPSDAPDRVNIPCFSLVWICSLKEFFDRTHDSQFVLDMLPYAERILAFFDDYLVENGLVSTPHGYWNFYEWSPMLSGIPRLTGQDETIIEAPLNAFYLMALRAYKAMCDSVGTSSSDVSEHIERLKEAYVQVFYSNVRRAYRLSTDETRREVYPDLVQALSIVAEVCDDVDVRRGLLLGIANGDFYPSVTLSHRIYYYQALMSEPDMKHLALEDVERHWLPMLKHGATSFWETELGAADFDDAGSLCHGWSAAPIWVFWQLFGE